MNCVTHHYACDCREDLFRRMAATAEAVLMLDQSVGGWGRSHAALASIVAEFKDHHGTKAGQENTE